MQLLLLRLTVSLIGLSTNLVIARCAARITGSLRRDASISLRLPRGFGAPFIVIGLRIAVEQV